MQQILLHADEGSAELREAALHLENCPRCQEKLAELCSSDALLEEACETLRDQGDATQKPGGGPASVVVAVDSLTGGAGPVTDGTIDCETVPLDFLEPGRHPEMLGRIGRYDVERLIGAGGMGIVLKGFDTELHRVVAIKVLLPHLANSSAARRRFAREAQAAAAVVHEHVIPIYDVQSEGTVPFLVMQFVPGHSLQTRVDEQGPLEIKDVLRIARQAAAGLSAAHAQGVVHRDVKPANILLEDSVDRVLISDFGLARTVDDATLTRTGVLAGTPHYMSPEQASGQSVDPRSDLFSLGSVIYFMCTWRPPYRADSPMAVLNRICNEPHQPVDEVNSDVPLELAELVDRLLAKDPARRYASAAEVESRCAILLSDLQQGRRFRRRRKRRFQWLSRLFSRRAATVGGAALGCMLLGAWGARTWTIGSPQRPAPLSLRGTAEPPPTKVTVVKSPSVEVATKILARLQQPTLPGLQKPTLEVPPDTFAQDLSETERLLAALEAERDHTLSSPKGKVDTQSEDELNQLRAKLVQIERPTAAVPLPSEIPVPVFRKEPGRNEKGQKENDQKKEEK